MEPSENKLRAPNFGYLGPSAVLQRVQAFLPTLAAANAELQERQEKEGPGCCDIENIEQAKGPLIEMDIALFTSEKSDQSSSDDDDDSSDVGTASCDCDEFNCSCTQRPVFAELSEETIKIPKNGKNNASKQCKRVMIEELGSNEDSEKVIEKNCVTVQKSCKSDSDNCCHNNKSQIT